MSECQLNFGYLPSVQFDLQNLCLLTDLPSLTFKITSNLQSDVSSKLNTVNSACTGTAVSKEFMNWKCFAKKIFIYYLADVKSRENHLPNTHEVNEGIGGDTTLKVVGKNLHFSLSLTTFSSYGYLRNPCFFFFPSGAPPPLPLILPLPSQSPRPVWPIMDASSPEDFESSDIPRPLTDAFVEM